MLVHGSNKNTNDVKTMCMVLLSMMVSIFMILFFVNGVNLFINIVRFVPCLGGIRIIPVNLGPTNCNILGGKLSQGVT